MGARRSKLVRALAGGAEVRLCADGTLRCRRPGNRGLPFPAGHGDLHKGTLPVGGLTYRIRGGRRVPMIKVRPGGLGFLELARLVYIRVHGAIPPGCVVAHVNGNPMDCRPENLAARSRAEVLAATMARMGPQRIGAQRCRAGLAAVRLHLAERMRQARRLNMARRRRLGLPAANGKRITQEDLKFEILRFEISRGGS